jgi:hypothetical protein
MLCQTTSGNNYDKTKLVVKLRRLPVLDLRLAASPSTFRQQAVHLAQWSGTGSRTVQNDD